MRNCANMKNKKGDLMKLLFISDIHGIKTNLPKIKKIFKRKNCDKLVVLGDLYYNYTKNINDKNYDKDYVKSFLESFGDQIICLQGNCDSNEDISNSKFSIINQIDIIRTINEDLYITHGNLYNESNWNTPYTTLIYGHRHIPFIKQIETNTYINPGSISLPRQNNKPTYLLYDEKKFVIYDLDDNIICEKIVQ